MPKKSDSSQEKPKVLDLIEDAKKPSRRERQRKEAEAVAPAPSALDAKKANALDLFAEEKKTKVRKTTRPAKAVLGTISKILDKEDPAPPPVAAPVVSSPPPAQPPGPPAAVSGDEPEDHKLIVIKPPILVPELASRLGLKPFNIMADLIKLGVFPAPNQPLEPEIAAKVCEIHGFTFEREKR